MSHKKVSVILPVRNGAESIKTAIDSALAQTYPHFELLVINRSEDETEAIVKSYADPRIRYYDQRSKGSVNGYNEALDLVDGDYVTFLHHDDAMAPDKLYEQVRMMEKYADVDCVYTDLFIVDKDWKLMRTRTHEEFYGRAADMRPVLMIGYGVYNLGMGILIKRAFIERHRLRYSLETPVCCDHEILFQMIDQGCVFKHVPKPLLYYRVHGANYSNDRDIVQEESLRIYARYPDLSAVVEATNFSAAEKAVLLGRLYFRMQRNQEAAEYMESYLTGHADPWGHFYLGVSYYRFMADFLNAERNFALAADLLPSRGEFYNDLACCRIQTGRGDEPETRELLTKSLELMPEYYDAKYNLEHLNDSGPFNPRTTDREIENAKNFALLWKDDEEKREKEGRL